MKNQFKSNLKSSVLVFKKWNRKGYSVFNTLSKVVKITTLTLSYSIVLLPLQVLSQTDTSITKNLDLEEVFVSAQRSPVLYSQLSRLVTTIDEDEINLMPVSSVNELLENFSGIDIRQRGANGVQADISVRGGSFDQNLILLNGVNITDPQTGHHSLNLPIDLKSVERIEILEGPGSRVFGPNAFSGAINIITNKSEENYTKVGFTAGDFGMYAGNMVSSLKFKNTKHFLSISKSQSNGYKKNTDYDQHNLFYNSNYNSAIGDFDFQIGYSNKAFGANSFYTPAYPDQYEQTKTTFTSLKFEAGERIKISPVIYYRRHKDQFELFRYEPASWYTNHNYHLTDVYGAKIDSRISTKLGVSSLGVEYRSENIKSNVLGNLTGDTIQVIGESEGFYTREYSRTTLNFFLEHSYIINRLSFSAGLLASWISEDYFNLFPGLDISYALTNKFKVYYTLNNSLRLPTFTDLFYNGPSNIGNPNLKPEEAWSNELGLKLKNRWINSTISFFYRDAQNVIEWVRDTTVDINSKWETQNLTHVKTYGLTFNNRININYLSINYINVNYTYLDQDVSSELRGIETKYSLNNLKHNFIININQHLFKHVSLTYSLKYQDRQGSYLKYNFEQNQYSGVESYEPYFLFDIKSVYQFRLFNVFAEATNIFNKKYSDIGNIEMPGRWFKAGFNVHISY